MRSAWLGTADALRDIAFRLAWQREICAERHALVDVIEAQQEYLRECCLREVTGVAAADAAAMTLDGLISRIDPRGLDASSQEMDESIMKRLGIDRGTLDNRLREIRKLLPRAPVGSWLEHHSRSEHFAAAAEVAGRAQDAAKAQELYREAAEAESRALAALPPEKHRTIAVTAVSAVALWFKAGDYQAATSLAYQWLDSDALPAFAIDQLHDIVRAISASEGITPELMKAIHPDPVAAEAYIRELLADLGRWLEWRGCHDPDGVAGEALYRALRKVAAGADISQSGLRAFVFGIAKYVAKESRRVTAREQQLEPPAWHAQPSRHRERERIEATLMLQDIQRLLGPEDWQTLFRYCTEKDYTAQCREMGVEPGYLRVIIHRIREQLKAKILSSPLGPGGSIGPDCPPRGGATNDTERHRRDMS